MTSIDRQHRASWVHSHFEGLGCRAETLLILSVKIIVVLSQVIALLMTYSCVEFFDVQLWAVMRST